jgi:hypothetical protein
MLREVNKHATGARCTVGKKSEGRGKKIAETRG